MKGSNEKEKFYEILRRSWSRETCFYKLQELWNENNPSYGQCAITTLILNDLFGGKIMRMHGRGYKSLLQFNKWQNSGFYN